MKFRKLKTKHHAIVGGEYPIYETACYQCVEGYILKGEQTCKNNKRRVMWFHSRDGFVRRFKTRDAALHNYRTLAIEDEE